MSVASVYAKVLLETESAGEGSQKTETELVAFLGALESSESLRTVLYGPLASHVEKAAVVKDISNRLNITPSLQRFLTLLIRKNRLSGLSEILSAYRALRFEATGGIMGSVVSAEALSSEDVRALSDSFGRKLGTKVSFNVEVDPELLAGVRVTVRGTTYDGSLKSQLTRLRDQVLTKG